MRKCIIANNETYHIFNRSIEQKPSFMDKREYLRALNTLNYYRFKKLPLKLSKALLLEINERENYFNGLKSNFDQRVEIISYCLIPNHFHFLIKQLLPNGISKFLSDFTNSYTRYFNTKHKRKGPLFEGNFKAVRIESNEQLVHTSRYIHLNPVTSFVIEERNLDNYVWSSLPEYLGNNSLEICNNKVVLAFFKNIETYRLFVHDQIHYAQELDKIKHLLLE